jgi:hypothetical protein
MRTTDALRAMVLMAIAQLHQWAYRLTAQGCPVSAERLEWISSPTTASRLSVGLIVNRARTLRIGRDHRNPAPSAGHPAVPAMGRSK